MNPSADARRALSSATLAGEQISAEGTFPVDLAVFAGHFPGHPLVPGVAVIALIQAACEQVFSAAIRIAVVERCKWKTPTVPGERLQLNIIAGAADENHQRRIKATITNATGVACEAHLVIVINDKNYGAAGR